MRKVFGIIHGALFYPLAFVATFLVLMFALVGGLAWLWSAIISEMEDRYGIS